MLEENARFMDEYNKLDNFMEKQFNSEKGVSDYIDRMYNTPDRLKKKAKSFDEDLKSLKHLRWMRNQLAHGDVTMNDDFAKDSDIDDIIAFYNKVVSKKDPLSLINKNGTSYTSSGKTSVDKSKILSIILVVLLIIYYLLTN